MIDGDGSMEQCLLSLKRIVGSVYGIKRQRGNSGVYDDINNKALHILHTLSEDQEISYDPILVSCIIRYRLIDIFLRSSAHCNSYKDAFPHISLDSVMMDFLLSEQDYYGDSTDNSLSVDSFEEGCVDNLTLKEAMEKTLDPIEQFILTLHFHKYTQEEIADNVPVGRSMVCKKLNIIKSKLKKELDDGI